MKIKVSEGLSFNALRRSHLKGHGDDYKIE